ncbi:MAG TPA: MFS transporter [Pseudonocardiaceae bacterium]|nr:MFS transporter [Pseudonocardiaceae bacterium]
MAALEQTRVRLLVPVLVFVCLVVAAVGSLGAPLVPTVAMVDRVPLADAQWTLTITLLAGAVGTPVLGRLGDGPHRRPVVIGTLAIVLAGSVLTALPLGFAALMIGRAAQGAGLGLTSLAIAIAREELPADRVGPSVSVLSITTVAGIGVGYPLFGLITVYLGLSAAYWAGAVVAGLALVAAALVLPPSPDRRAARLDVQGAVLLGLGVAGLLLALSEAVSWPAVPLLGLAAGSVLVLGVWVWHELRAAAPLVDLRLVGNRAVRTADVTVLLGGIGMYLLMAMVARFVQTPTSAGYGFGASVVVAGLVLTPFSLLGFVAGRVMPALTRRVGTRAVLPVSCLIVLVATVGFAVARAQLWQVFVVMAVAGFGVGCVFAAVPGFIVRSVPVAETGSAMSFNQVLRTVGFSAGSALTGVVLAAYTPAGHVLPTGDGYGTAALFGIAVLAVTIVFCAMAGRRAG